MNRIEFEKYLIDNYQAKRVCPWAKYPSFATFRGDNDKCFAICMDITADKIGLENDAAVQVVNLKCNPYMISSLVCENGIFPAYHMNKEHWISVLINGVEEEKLKILVDISYGLTALSKKR